jgi:hypothetical protein
MFGGAGPAEINKLSQYQLNAMVLGFPSPLHFSEIVPENRQLRASS